MTKDENIEDNIVYDMQKTQTNISTYKVTKLTHQRDLLLSYLNQMKGRQLQFSIKEN